MFAPLSAMHLSAIVLMASCLFSSQGYSMDLDPAMCPPKPSCTSIVDLVAPKEQEGNLSDAQRYSKAYSEILKLNDLPDYVLDPNLWGIVRAAYVAKIHLLLSKKSISLNLQERVNLIISLTDAHKELTASDYDDFWKRLTWEQKETIAPLLNHFSFANNEKIEDFSRTLALLPSQCAISVSPEFWGKLDSSTKTYHALRISKIGYYEEPDSPELFLSQFPNLSEVHFNGYKCDEKSMSSIANFLKNKKNISSIDFSMCEAGDTHAVILSEALKENKTLKIISMRGGREIIYAYMNPGVEFDYITSKGARSIAEAVQPDSTLEFLDLSDHKIGDDGALALLDMILRTPSIKAVSLRANPISSNVIFQFKTQLENRKIQVMFANSGFCPFDHPIEKLLMPLALDPLWEQKEEFID